MCIWTGDVYRCVFEGVHCPPYHARSFWALQSRADRTQEPCTTWVRMPVHSNPFFWNFIGQTIYTAVQALWTWLAKYLDKNKAREGDSRRKDEETLVSSPCSGRM